MFSLKYTIAILRVRVGHYSYVFDITLIYPSWKNFYGHRKVPSLATLLISEFKSVGFYKASTLFNY